MSVQEDLKTSPEERRLAAWMVQVQAGDSAAYRSLLTELTLLLGRYAARAVRRSGPDQDAALARDIVQEALLAIHEKRHTYDPSQRFLPWVFGIARHKLIDWQRKRFSEARWLDVSLGGEEEIPAPETSDAPGDLAALMSELPTQQREVLELTKLQGLSVAETALKLGLSEANVKVITHRGVAALRKLFEAKHE